LFKSNNLQDKVVKWRGARSWHCEFKLSELQLGTTGLKAELQEGFLTYYGLNNGGESETEDNGKDGLSATSAESL